MIKRIALTTTALAVLAAAASAQTFTSSLSVPTTSITYVQATSISTNTTAQVNTFLAGPGLSGTGYTFLLSLVTAVAAPDPADPFSTVPTGIGSASILDSLNNPVLTLDFLSGTLSDNGFVVDALADGGTYSVIDPALQPFFGNSVANGLSVSFSAASSGDQTFVADFTATPVPEPASMAVLGLGAAAMLRRRRKA